MDPIVVPIVLAAGASRRMGQPKALLDFAGLTALARIALSSAEAGLATPLVVVGHDASRVRPEAERLGCAVVQNPDPARGQTSSLQVGLESLPSEAHAFLLWPVDVPLVAAATLRALVVAGGAVVLPRHRGRRGHPALFAAALRPRFLALAPGEPASRVVAEAGEQVVEVDVDDPRVLDRLNTREDYAAVLRAWRG